MICLKAKNSVKTETWSNIFSSFNTEVKSCLFMKQLTNVCISTILFLRKVLPEDFFETKSFEEMSLKFLKSRPGDNYIMKIQEWLEGAFDAIEKKYLKRLMLDIQDAESNKILEVYTMSFSYWNEKDSSNPSVSSTSVNDRFTELNTKMNTVKLLQMCYAITQTYRSLPSKVNLDIRLCYYKNTPDEYQPRGYTAWEHSNTDFLNQARSIEIGITNTRHHVFKLFNKSSLNDRFLKNMEDQLKNTTSTAVTKGEDLQGSEKFSQLRPTKAKRELSFNIDHQNFKTSSSSTSKLNTKSSVFEVTEKDVSLSRKNYPKKTKLKNIKNQTMRCSCLFSKKSESVFSCSSCGFFVHSECFGILEFDSSKKIRFCCHLCHQKESTYRCHDKILVSLKSSSDQQKLSLLRRILKHCSMPFIKTITLKKMEKIAGSDCQNNVINIILKKMIEMGVIIPQGKKKSFLIEKNKLANKLAVYFYKIQNSSTQQILPYSLRSTTFKRQDEKDDLHCNTKKEKLVLVSQEGLTQRQDVSQLSYDIFS